MRTWLIILSFLSHLTVVAQEYVEIDVKSLLDGMGMQPEQSFTISEKYLGIFNDPMVLFPPDKIQGMKIPHFTGLKNPIENTFWTISPYSHLHNSTWKPIRRLSIMKSSLINQRNMVVPLNVTKLDLKIEYKLTDKIFISLYGSHIINGNNNTSMYSLTPFKSEICTNLSYSITRNLKLKAGIQYQYNMMTRSWECMYQTGITYLF